MMENTESQEMEILALQNIFEDRVFEVQGMDPPRGRIVADVRLPSGFCIKTETIGGQDSALNNHKNASESFEVEYLPPIALFFEFPDSYPSQSPPAFLLSCNWLTLDQLSKLSKQLENLWAQSNDAVLYTWIQFLLEETLDFLSIVQCLDITHLLQFKITDNFRSTETDEQKDENLCDPQYSKSSSQHRKIQPSVHCGHGATDARAFNDLTDGKNLPQFLRLFNEQKKNDVFDSTSHVCDICFLTVEGYDFIRFKACKHAFCKFCLKSYFEVQIAEGNFNSMHCPDEKCDTQADGSIVKQVVSKELFEKYDTILLSRTLDRMADVAYCPRRDCQCPLLLETCGRMGLCPACKFVFCPFCNMAYHGVAQCIFKLPEKAEIYNTYMQATPEEQAEIEKKYGRRTVRSVIEDVLSEKWIDSNSKSCPQCEASIEKADGCNKMTCFRCGTYFCWLCVTKLDQSNPYFHFGDRRGECQLFPQEVVLEYMFEPGEFLGF